MTINAADSALLQRLHDVRRDADKQLSREDVAEILAQVIGSLEGDVSAIDLKIYNELEALVRYIQTAREEIAAIRPHEIGEEFISSATDELDAVVGATEDATGRILDAAESIQTIAESLEEDTQNALIEKVTDIFEASNFQDLTGQRISKVVRTLKHIEERIHALVTVLGEEVERARQQNQKEADGPDSDDEQNLLNGPQLPGGGNDQDEIDRLLASFD